MGNSGVSSGQGQAQNCMTSAMLNPNPDPKFIPPPCCPVCGDPCCPPYPGGSTLSNIGAATSGPTPRAGQGSAGLFPGTGNC
jgi:hypothetical protein